MSVLPLDQTDPTSDIDIRDYLMNERRQALAQAKWIERALGIPSEEDRLRAKIHQLEDLIHKLRT